jgi:hypothetical protein
MTGAAAFAGFGFTVVSVIGIVLSLGQRCGWLSPAAAISRWTPYSEHYGAMQHKYCIAQTNMTG